MYGKSNDASGIKQAQTVNRGKGVIPGKSNGTVNRGMVKRGVHPIFLEILYFEIAVGPLGPTSGPTFLGVFEVRDPSAPAWRHAQIWAPKMVISENGPKPGLRVLYG